VYEVGKASDPAFGTPDMCGERDWPQHPMGYMKSKALAQVFRTYRECISCCPLQGHLDAHARRVVLASRSELGSFLAA
jgi:hypothetical protein